MCQMWPDLGPVSGTSFVLVVLLLMRPSVSEMSDCHVKLTLLGLTANSNSSFLVISMVLNSPSIQNNSMEVAYLVVAGGPGPQVNQRCCPNDEYGLPKPGGMSRRAGGSKLGNGVTEASRGISQTRPGEENVQLKGSYSGEAREFRICCPELLASYWVFLPCRSSVIYLKESNFNDEELGSDELFISQISLIL